MTLTEPVSSDEIDSAAQTPFEETRRRRGRRQLLIALIALLVAAAVGAYLRLSHSGRKLLQRVDSTLMTIATDKLTPPMESTVKFALGVGIPWHRALPSRPLPLRPSSGFGSSTPYRITRTRYVCQL
jgi:hypothetical protein